MQTRPSLPPGGSASQAARGRLSRIAAPGPSRVAAPGPPGLAPRRPARIAAHNAARIFGGLERWTVTVLAALQSRGHEVALFCRAELLERAAAAGVPARRLRIGGDAMIPDAVRFAGALRRMAPDALLLTSYRKLWLAAMAGRIAKVPRVAARISYGAYVPASAKYRGPLRHWVDVTATNAERLRRSVLDAVPGLDPARVVTIYNGVRPPPEDAPTRVEARWRLGLPPHAFVVACVARLDPIKRIDRLLRALTRLHRRAVCLVAGEGAERAALERLAVEVGVAERTRFLGYVDDPGAVYAASDALVVASETEGMSSSMLEAMAWGVPVVSTPVSGADEALDPLEDGSAPGVIVEPTPEAIAAALRRLEADEELRRRMGEAGRRRAAERFGFGRMVDQWEDLLVGGEPRAPRREDRAATRPGLECE